MTGLFFWKRASRGEEKLVCGLGNPGPRYAWTRHNAGYLVVERLASLLGGKWRNYKDLALTARVEVGGTPVLLVKPLTFMNLSGTAVAPLLSASGLDLDELLVVADDLDLPLGVIRLRPKGSAGGHRGLASVISSLGSSNFPRLRLGIGRPPAGCDVVSYVLSPFAPEERPIFEKVLDRAAAAVQSWVAEGIAAAMNKFNRNHLAEA